MFSNCMFIKYLIAYDGTFGEGFFKKSFHWDNELERS